MSDPKSEYNDHHPEGCSYDQVERSSSYPQQGDPYSGQHSSNGHGTLSPYAGTSSCHCGSAHRLAVPMDTHTPTPPPYEFQQQPGENASYYQHTPPYDGADSSHTSENRDSERGLGSTVTGGAAGGYAAHQMGGGKLATAGGALLGAVGMNMATHKIKQNYGQQQQQQPAQTVVVVPAQGAAPSNGLGGGLGLGSGLGMGGGIGLGRVHRRLARRGIGM
ncbi:hypothetical protein PENPOL_c002G03116 [Penicillium polonicum]|uniref:Glycine zipper 2TM domain-containing protein n=1 Tax=Penicillium polonicum TaxID=60169 RepID=A0A1V6NX46_PENPO|nr:hypothetical protein PENPOL_c002G03116 [Penicillium polonicum]